jgi:hypothetical protein
MRLPAELHLKFSDQMIEALIGIFLKMGHVRYQKVCLFA